MVAGTALCAGGQFVARDGTAYQDKKCTTLKLAPNCVNIGWMTQAATDKVQVKCVAKRPTCADGKYQVSASAFAVQVCADCADAGCKTCTGSGAKKCTVSADGYYDGAVAAGVMTPVACATGCAKCTGADACTMWTACPDAKASGAAVSNIIAFVAALTGAVYHL